MTKVPTTETEAREMGWTVDHHTYPWIAYLGPRFTPDHIVSIYTPAISNPMEGEAPENPFKMTPEEIALRNEAPPA